MASTPKGARNPKTDIQTLAKDLKSVLVCSAQTGFCLFKCSKI